jgi:hypothetical protein
MRERTEATAERVAQLQELHAQQLERLSGLTQRSIVRVQTFSRSDALDLGARIGDYRWYLVAPDDEHLDVVIEVSGDPEALPADLRRRIEDWLARSTDS